MRKNIIKLAKCSLPLICSVITIIMQFSISTRAQELYTTSEHMDQTKIFNIEKEVKHLGKTYQLGRLSLKDGMYGPLTLRVRSNEALREHVAPKVDYLEISDVQLIRLKGRPFFFVKGRYQLFLIDLEKERIAPLLRPGVGVNFSEDAISGQMNGFQFFDDDNYLLGIAVNYGVFCFNISNLDHPKELLRYSSDFSDQGQPYFFLEQNPDGSYNGLVSRSDTTKKSTYVSNFYTATKKARYLFQDAHLSVPEEAYADPADYEIGHPEPFLLLQKVGSDGRKTPWVIDLKKAELLKGKQASRFLEKQ